MPDLVIYKKEEKSMAKYCRNCGAELKENQAVCLKCGAMVEDVNKSVSVEDDGNIGWGFLGFFVPIAGLVLYLIWKDKAPKNARMAGKGALISVIIEAVSVVFVLIIYFGLFAFTGALASGMGSSMTLLTALM